MAKEQTQVISVRLPVSVAERLRSLSARRQKPVGELVAEAVREKYSALDEDEGRADIGLAEFIGSVSTGTPTDASRIEEEFGRILEKRRAEGRM